MTARELDAWLYGTHLATLKPGSRPGTVEMTWTRDARDRSRSGSRVVSHLLPIEPRSEPHPARARVWLEGLLPEGAARSNLALDVGVDPEDTLGFLSHYGRDTAGAVVLAPAGSPRPERSGHLEHVGDEQISEMLSRAEGWGGPRGDRRDSLTSLAGLEPKITLALDPAGGWARCIDGAPSTHILKLSRPAGSAAHDVIDTEAASLDLARHLGLTDIEATVKTFGTRRCIVVSRYDRPVGPDGTIGRLHQEDAAQALGIDTRDPERKFQRGRGLPSLAAIADVLRAGGSEPDELLRLTTFTIAVGNTDAHAKNISFLRFADGTARLAPAYDIAMHMHSSAASGVSAMDVNGRRQMVDLTAQDLVDEGIAWGLPRRRALRAVATTLDQLDHALVQIDRGAHTGVSKAAWETVERRTRALASQVPGGVLR